MDVQAHTTPASRQELRNYLRNRRLVTSIHQIITTQTLNDLEDALQLLQAVRSISDVGIDEIDAFLVPRIGKLTLDPSQMIPGLLDQHWPSDPTTSGTSLGSSGHPHTGSRRG